MSKRDPGIQRRILLPAALFRETPITLSTLILFFSLCLSPEHKTVWGQNLSWGDVKIMVPFWVP